MKYVLPFNIELEPMIRLAVISFKGNEEFDGFEPQLFDDAVNGKGIRLLRYRKDKKVDVYYETGVITDQNLSIGAGINEIEMTHFEQKTFEVTKQGLQLHLVFSDSQGRKNELHITEQSKKKFPVPILAPIGGEIEDPEKLFFCYMKETDFSYHRYTKINCSIDEQNLEPLALPIIIKGKRTYMVRYSTKINVLSINKNDAEPLIFDGLPGNNMVQNETVVSCNKQGKVEKIQVGNDNNAMLYFPNGFPNLLDLPEKLCIKGILEIYILSQKITTGQYQLIKMEDKVTVELNQFEEWKPRKYPMAYKLLFTFVKIFKVWPSHFSYKGTVDLNDIPVMKGVWKNQVDHKSKVI